MKISTLLIILLISTSFLTAQEKDESPPAKSFYMFVGPYFGTKIGVNTDNPDGRQNKEVFVLPDFGVTALVFFNKNSNNGGMLSLGYDTYGFTTKPYKNATDQNTITEKYGYFNISPEFYLSGFIVGMNFGFPVSASSVNQDGDDVSVIKNSRSDLVDIAGTLIEVKLGANIKIFSDETGTLHLNIVASYPVMGILKNPELYDFAYDPWPGGNYKEDLNPKPASVMIGINYLFKIGF